MDLPLLLPGLFYLFYPFPPQAGNFVQPVRIALQDIKGFQAEPADNSGGISRTYPLYQARAKVAFDTIDGIGLYYFIAGEFKLFTVARIGYPGSRQGKSGANRYTGQEADNRYLFLFI